MSNFIFSKLCVNRPQKKRQEKVKPRYDRMKDINGGRGVEMKINETREKAIKMKQEGKSYGKISKELNISKNTIKSWVRRANISSYNGNKPKSKKLNRGFSSKIGGTKISKKKKNLKNLILLWRKIKY